MDGHGAHARVAAVGVIEPVVVVADVVGAALALHAAERHLARIPEVVVGVGVILRVALQVERAVALGLIGVAAGAAVEEVDVVDPSVEVVAVERYAVVGTEHDAEVAQLHIVA